MEGFGKLLFVLVVAAISGLVGGGWFAAGVIITTPAMEPALPQGTRAFVNYYSHTVRDLKRGELVLVRVPGEEFTLIRRVIAFRGEKVEISNSEVIINGSKLIEPWLKPPNTEPKFENPYPDFFPATVVGDDHIFVLADIRKGPRDSRHFGAVKRELILGTVWTFFGMTL
jgi:signal peptidase I